MHGAKFLKLNKSKTKSLWLKEKKGEKLSVSTHTQQVAEHHKEVTLKLTLLLRTWTPFGLIIPNFSNTASSSGTVTFRGKLRIYTE